MRFIGMLVVALVLGVVVQRVLTAPYRSDIERVGRNFGVNAPRTGFWPAFTEAWADLPAGAKVATASGWFVPVVFVAVAA
ncbi:MAG: hypothetical protein AB7G36_18835 [Candidatus Nanopelagicales bacterium]